MQSDCYRGACESPTVFGTIEVSQEQPVLDHSWEPGDTDDLATADQLME